MNIRTFRNNDCSGISKVWNSHYEHFGSSIKINSQRLELFALAKPYFDETKFLVAEVDGEVMGFLHSGPLSTPDLKDYCWDRRSIAALCVKQHEDEDRIAAMLMATFLQNAVSEGVTECIFKPTLPDCAFYLGLGPADSLIGATSTDSRVCRWLQAAKFEPTMPTCLWELDLQQFTAPVDRLQIQIRRAAQVNRELDEPVLPWWQAAILGHAEPTNFQLTDRTERRVVGELLCWSISTELRHDRDSVIWLWPLTHNAGGLNRDQYVFLITEALREFQSEHIDLVRTVSRADESESTEILRRLGFNSTHNGLVFKRSF